MKSTDLDRLERQIGGVLRGGVLLSATAFALSLFVIAAGWRGAAILQTVGLISLMAIPVVRIIASCFDAIRRQDRLLVWATVYVLTVMLITVVYSNR